MPKKLSTEPVTGENGITPRVEPHLYDHINHQENGCYSLKFKNALITFGPQRNCGTSPKIDVLI